MTDLDILTDALLKLILVREPSKSNQELIRERALELAVARAASETKPTGNLAGRLLPEKEYRQFLSQFIGMGRIEAIKTLRNQIDCSLLDGKEFIDATCKIESPSENTMIPKIIGHTTLHVKLPNAYR